MRRRNVMVVYLLILLILGWWFLQREVPSDEQRALGSQPVHQLAPIPHVSTPKYVKDPPRDPVTKASKLQTGARTNFYERLAEAMGKLHVRCFVGEEHPNDHNMDNGWFFTNTDHRSGSAGVGGSFDTHLIVRWDAPEGATQTTCTLEEPKWGYVKVHVRDEDGRPLAGVGVLGCGGLYETGTDGMADFAMLVMDKPCVLDVLRWDPATRIHSQAYIRVLPLVENEERTYRVNVAPFDVPKGESVQFDLVSLIEAEDIPEIGIPEVYEPEIPSRGIADYEERLESGEEFYRILKEVYGKTPEEERWVVDEEIERTLKNNDALRESLEMLYAGEKLL